MSDKGRTLHSRSYTFGIVQWLTASLVIYFEISLVVQGHYPGCPFTWTTWVVASNQHLSWPPAMLGGRAHGWLLACGGSHQLTPNKKLACGRTPDIALKNKQVTP